MPKVSSSSYTQRRARTVAAILLLSEITPSPCSRCAKEGLLYITLLAPSGCQPSSYSKCMKLKMRLFYNMRVISNAKYTRPMTLNSLQVP